MNVKGTMTALLVSAGIAAAGTAAAANSNAAATPADGTGGQMHGCMHGPMNGMHDGMHHGGMMGMMGMNGCGDMMGGSSASLAMPQLPPGNEKLQMQMRGEMMQKMGEILSKYAAQLPDRAGSR